MQLVVALPALAGGSAALVVEAARALGLDDAALGRAEEAGLVDLDGDHLAPRHPLVGSAVYSSLRPEQRRRLHAAVAEALPPGRTDERARHLAAAAAGPDEDLAAALEEVAAAAARRGAPAVAAAGLERAAGITPDAGRRTQRLLAAAEAAWAAGDAAWATRLCDEVARAAGGPAPPWRAEALAGSIAARSGSLDVARRSLLGAAGPAGDQDPEAASRIVAEAVTLAFNLADAGVAAAAGTRATVLLAGDLSAAARGRCLMTTGIAAVFGGGSGEAELRAALTQLRMPAAHPPPDGIPRNDSDDDEDAVWALIVMLYLRGSEAVDELSREIDSRRASWAVGTLPRLLFLLARADATRDRWVPARSAYAESIELAHELGQVTEQAMSLAGLAWLEARTGAATCAEQRRRVPRPGDPAVERASPRCGPGSRSARRRWPRAPPTRPLERFTRLDALLGRTGFVDVDVHPGPELAECLVLVGRADDARRRRRRLRPPGPGQGPSLGAGAGRPGARRCSSSRAASTTCSARPPASTPSPQTCSRPPARGCCTASGCGASRRRADAREPLRDALEAFERLGAVPWADRAADELDATGATVVRRGHQRPRRAQPARAADRRAGDRGAHHAGDGAAACSSARRPWSTTCATSTRGSASPHARARGPGPRERCTGRAVSARHGIRSSSMTPNPPRVDPALVPALRADLVASRYTVAGVTELLGPMATRRPRPRPVAARAAGDRGRHDAPAPPWCGCSPSATRSTSPRRRPRCPPSASTARSRSDWSCPRATPSSRCATCAPTPPTASTGGWPPTSARWPPAARCGRTTCSASAAPRPPWPRGRPGRTSTARSTSAPAAACRPCTSRPTPTRSSSPTCRERALAFARFNAALDEADWDVRAGSMLDPVAGERFGLVVSNPPFVITPRSGAVPLFEYRDGGAAGDAVVRDLVRAVGDHLEPRRHRAVPRQLGGAARLDVDRAGGGLARRHRARRLGRAARGAGPRRVRRDLGARRRPPPAARPTSTRCTRRGSTTSRPATSRRSASGS